MKKYIRPCLAIIALAFFGLSIQSQKVLAVGADKACVYTVDTPDSTRVDCFGAGSVCSGVAECPAPKLGQLN